MMEAANTAVRHDDRMAAVYESARRRHTDKHGPAVVVVANKMLTIAWHMLNTRTNILVTQRKTVQTQAGQDEKGAPEVNLADPAS